MYCILNNLYNKGFIEILSKITPNNITSLIIWLFTTLNIKKYVNNIYYCKDSIDAEKKLREIIKENDVIYFKGSNGMKVNTIVENLKKDFMN